MQFFKQNAPFTNDTTAWVLVIGYNPGPILGNYPVFTVKDAAGDVSEQAGLQSPTTNIVSFTDPGFVATYATTGVVNTFIDNTTSFTVLSRTITGSQPSTRVFVSVKKILIPPGHTLTITVTGANEMLFMVQGTLEEILALF